MTKPELGTKRACVRCGARFYDLLRSPITCPKCGTVFEAPKVRSRFEEAPKPERDAEGPVARLRETVASSVSRFSNRETCIGYHGPRPRGGRTQRALSAVAMALGLVTPAACRVAAPPQRVDEARRRAARAGAFGEAGGRCAGESAWAVKCLPSEQSVTGTAAPSAHGRAPPRSQGAAAPRDEGVDVVGLVEHGRAASRRQRRWEETPGKTWARLRRGLRSYATLCYEDSGTYRNRA
jgi:Protein of unknown function (FYDLN_acid)